MTRYASLDIVPVWARLNEEVIKLVDYVPDDKMNWGPKEGLWSIRGYFLHIALARHNWMGRDVKDAGESVEDQAALAAKLLQEGQSRDGMKEQLRLSWQRVERFLADPAKLDAHYDGIDADGATVSHSGHWIAYHLLEHDVHHRADIFHYLALLDIEHPEVGTP